MEGEIFTINTPWRREFRIATRSWSLKEIAALTLKTTDPGRDVQEIVASLDRASCVELARALLRVVAMADLKDAEDV